MASTTGPSVIRKLKEDELAVAGYVADGAISPTATTAKLNKGSVGAYTLAAPAAADEGRDLYLVSDSAFAHVVTSTGNIQDGVTGGAKNTMSFDAFNGASIHLKALGRKWYIMAKNAVTVA